MQIYNALSQTSSESKTKKEQKKRTQNVKLDGKIIATTRSLFLGLVKVNQILLFNDAKQRAVLGSDKHLQTEIPNAKWQSHNEALITPCFTL